MQPVRMVQATFLTIPAGDWLEAGSTIVAISATVAVTLWIERRSRTATDKEHLARLREALTYLMMGGPNRTGEANWREAGEIEASLRAPWVRQALYHGIETYAFVRSETRVNDLKVWRAINDVDILVARLQANRPTEPSHVLGAAEMVVYLSQKAIDAIDGKRYPS